MASPVSAQLENVGNLSFPTSGSATAQRHFLRGVAILHSFGWKQAIAEFKLAQQAQPDFALAYWGEAMSYNHPLWAEQDVPAARTALLKLAPTRAARVGKAPTERERAYLEAVEILYGEGDKLERDRAGEQQAAAFNPFGFLFGRHSAAGALAPNLFFRNVSSCVSTPCLRMMTYCCKIESVFDQVQ